MRRGTTTRILNAVALLATVAVNGLANALPLNDLTTGEISDRFEVYFVPAGYVFSIWGVIYLALIGFVVFQSLPAQRDNPRLARIGLWFVLSCAANTAWLFLWHYLRFPLTLLAMALLLVSLIAIYLRLDIGRRAVPTAERWLVDVPFSLYLGWITVATIANATSLLYSVGWSGWGIGPQVWAVVMLVAAAGIASVVSLTRGDVVYLLVILWALAGIAVKHAGTALVATTAWLAAAVVAVMTVVGELVGRRRREPGRATG
jgi:benzodiazapine receptor